MTIAVKIYGNGYGHPLFENARCSSSISVRRLTNVDLTSFTPQWDYPRNNPQPGANRTLASADKKVNKLETPCGASVYLCGVSFSVRKYVPFILIESGVLHDNTGTKSDEPRLLLQCHTWDRKTTAKEASDRWLPILLILALFAIDSDVRH